MTAIAIHRVRTGKGMPFEPVGVWVIEGEQATPFYPHQHEKYRDRGWKAIVERPMESAEHWIGYKASTSPSWRLYEPKTALFDIGEPDAGSVYEEVRGEFEAQMALPTFEASSDEPLRVTGLTIESADPVPGNWGSNRFAVAQSWWIASELVRRHPELMIYEMHPGGGQYDVLCVAAPDQFTPNPSNLTHRVMLNRAGTIQIHRGGHSEVVANWISVLEAAGPHEIVKDIEARTGWGSPSSSPATTERAIGYRFFAAALAMLINDRHPWDVRSESLDSSAWGLSRAGLISEFADVAAEVAVTPRLGIHGEPHSHYWALRRGAETVAVVSMEGHIYRRGVPRRALMDAYAKSDGRLVAMVTDLLRKWL
ncbi:TY-Chap2 family putative peptide chaperone [Microbacterium sp. F51-2R]|uniref:TY-Chap2 family putative peptide chaperone n=1 Tax=Microbacterium sp. F51-2R TaxID=3445777 RepID=UPI003FA08274